MKNVFLGWLYEPVDICLSCLTLLDFFVKVVFSASVWRTRLVSLTRLLSAIGERKQLTLKIGFQHDTEDPQSPFNDVAA